MLPTLQKLAGEENVILTKATTGGEDFSYFQEEVPGFYFFLGGMTPGNTTPYPHHTPDFQIDDDEWDLYDALTRFVEDQSIRAAADGTATNEMNKPKTKKQPWKKNFD